MNDKINNPFVALVIISLSVALFALVFLGANFVCRLNFYNTYIDNGIPANLNGDGFIDRLLLGTRSGDFYSIRFTSKDLPHYLKNTVDYLPVPEKLESPNLGPERVYSKEPELAEIIQLLKEQYRGSSGDLDNIKSLCYFHRFLDKNYWEHHYLIRNNSTGMNYFIIEDHYTGT